MSSTANILLGLIEPGQPVALPANQPLVLRSPDSVWRIERGRADIFAVSMRHGTPTSTGLHLFRAEVGDLLFSIEPLPVPSGDEWGLMVVGLLNTFVVQLSRTQLES